MRQVLIKTRLCISLIVIFSWCVSSQAIETNPFISISSLNDQSLGIVHAIEVGDGIVWLAADNGIFGLQGDITYHYGAETELFDNAVLDIKIDSRSNVWAATFGSGVFSFHTTGGITLSLDEDDGLLSDYVLRLEYLSKRYLIIATIKGAQVFDTEKEQFLNLSQLFNYDFILEESDIEKINESSFFLLSKTSSYLLNISTLAYEEIKLPEKVFNSLVYRIQYDQSGTVWISTSSGTYSYDLQTKLTAQHTLETPNNISARDFLQIRGNSTLVAAEGIYQHDNVTGTINVTEHIYSDFKYLLGNRFIYYR